MKKICHLTSVHNAIDTRIFHKECFSLTKKFNVHLIGIHNKREIIKNINIIPFPKFKNRFIRILISPILMFFYALKYKANLYHCHDPELLITMFLLKIFTNSKLIYDMHEDYFSGIIQKNYLSKSIKMVIAKLTRKIELIFCNKVVDTVIIAEQYYKKIVKHGIAILNYPIISNIDSTNYNKNKEIKLIYTGTVSIDRGALLQSKIVDYVDTCSVDFVGYCNKKLVPNIYSNIKNKNKLNINGINKYIPRERIDNEYEKGKWLAALAIFPKSTHYFEKELTKFFEYMCAGLPIIASDFPVWKSVIEKNKCGICVNPNDKEAIRKAILELYNNNDLRKHFSQNGKEMVQKKYNWNTQEKILLNLYDQVFNN